MEQRQIHGDNQQQRFLDWFGGIIDGEGCITFKCRWQRNRYIQINPVIIITNTSKELIDECIDGLNGIGIPYWMTVKHPKTKTKDGMSLQSVYHIEVSGLKRIARLIPYLKVRAKKDQVELLRKFTESRLRLDGRVKTPYTTEELKWVEELARKHTRKNAQRLYARLLQKHQGE